MITKVTGRAGFLSEISATCPKNSNCRKMSPFTPSALAPPAVISIWRVGTMMVSESDIAVGPRWLSQVMSALAGPGVGIVTCLYTGEPARDGHPLWSSLAAMSTSYTFLPNAVLGTALGLASPCFGSTIALRRQTLDAAGGFAAFADHLADDYEM